jgi:hypothetical protein
MGPRIPKLTKRGLRYWKNKGKYGKDVMLYFHDDLDGIFSAVVVKERLLELGYNIKGYGVVNYHESWELTSLDPKMINVVVDFANMPNSDRKDLIDIYIDHHGEFTEEEKEFYKSNPVIKTKTASAYEGICRVIGEPLDRTLLYTIDMVDSAKYDDYNVEWIDILDFNWCRFQQLSRKTGTITVTPFEESGPTTIGWGTIAKLTFAGAFNQYIKRGDHKTLIEVVANLKCVSIYSIYSMMKKIYPFNNVWLSGYSKGQRKEFLKDGRWRITEMQKRTRGSGDKIFIEQQDFIDATKGKPIGYKIIGRLMYIPNGSWANSLRARAVLDQDYINEVIGTEWEVDYIALQYGSTIQVCSYGKLEDVKNPPVLKGTGELNDLGQYMGNLLENFKKYFGYYDSETSVGQDDLTMSGGHRGIGTISNIVGSIDVTDIAERDGGVTDLMNRYDGHKYLDLIKNKIINDLSGVEWKIGMKWDEIEDQMTEQMIHDIIKNKESIKVRIELYLNNNLGNGKEYTLRNAVKKEIKAEFLSYSKEDLKELHTEVMMNHKVMMAKDVRMMDESGNFERFQTYDEFMLDMAE